MVLHEDWYLLRDFSLGLLYNICEEEIDYMRDDESVCIILEHKYGIDSSEIQFNPKTGELAFHIDAISRREEFTSLLADLATDEGKLVRFSSATYKEPEHLEVVINTLKKLDIWAGNYCTANFKYDSHVVDSNCVSLVLRVADVWYEIGCTEGDKKSFVNAIGEDLFYAVLPYEVNIRYIDIPSSLQILDTVEELYDITYNEETGKEVSRVYTGRKVKQDTFVRILLELS